MGQRVDTKAAAELVLPAKAMPVDSAAAPVPSCAVLIVCVAEEPPVIAPAEEKVMELKGPPVDRLTVEPAEVVSVA